jgi:hypothetical protein
MMNNRKTLQEFSPHIPQTASQGNGRPVGAGFKLEFEVLFFKLVV